MPSPLSDIDVLFHAVKALRDERRKMERMSEKAAAAPHGKLSKLMADLHWQAHHVSQLEHRVHVEAVNCGYADVREAEHYQPRTVRFDGWHDMYVEPVKPRQLLAKEEV